MRYIIMAYDFGSIKRWNLILCRNSRIAGSEVLVSLSLILPYP